MSTSCNATRLDTSTKARVSQNADLAGSVIIFATIRMPLPSGIPNPSGTTSASTLVPGSRKKSDSGSNFACSKVSMERRAGFIIENKCREVLLVLGRYANKWSFPKGHTEPGETELECAERELREETGRTLEGTEEDLGVGTFSRTCTYFLRRTNEMDLFSSGRRDKREIKRIKWFNKEELLGLAREEVNRDVHSYILSIADTEQ